MSKSVMPKEFIMWDGDILRLKLDEETLKKLRKIQFIKISDYNGDPITTFWRGKPE